MHECTKQFIQRAEISLRITLYVSLLQTHRYVLRPIFQRGGASGAAAVVAAGRCTRARGCQTAPAATGHDGIRPDELQELYLDAQAAPSVYHPRNEELQDLRIIQLLIVCVHTMGCLNLGARSDGDGQYDRYCQRVLRRRGGAATGGGGHGNRVC
jgi:hypothetical protein